MKVLLYAPYAVWHAHLATQLELALKHINEGDEVHIAKCRGVLPLCGANRNYDEMMCVQCRSFARKGFKLLELPSERFHDIKAHSQITIPEFESLEELKSYDYKGTDAGLSAASILISHYREPQPNVKETRRFILDCLTSYASVYDSMNELLDKLKPQLLYIFNGRDSVTRPAMRAAQKKGIRVITHERIHREGYVLFDNAFPQDLFALKKELSLFAEKMKSDPLGEKEAADWFLQRRDQTEDLFYLEWQLPKKDLFDLPIDENKQNIAIYNSSEDETEAFDEWKNPFFKNQQAAIEFILDNADENKTHFYFRVHPNLHHTENSQMRAIRAMSRKNLTVILPNSPIDSYALMERCHKTITFGSTIGIEATFWERPSILLGKAIYEDLPACYLPKDKTEIVDLIRKELPAKNKKNALPYGYWYNHRMVPFKYIEPAGGKVGGDYLKGIKLILPLHLRLLSKFRQKMHTLKRR